LLECKHNLLLASLGGGLGLLGILVGLLDGLDDTDSDGLTHITDGEATKWWVFGERLDAHWLGWDHLYDSSITRLDELWTRLSDLTGTTIDLLDEGVELAGNVSSVAIEDWSVTSTDLTWMVKNNNLGGEGGGLSGWVVLGVGADVTTTDILDGNVLDVETDVVTWLTTLGENFVMHFNGLDFSGDVGWGKGNEHTGLDDTGLDTTDWNCTDTTDLVHILKWEAEWLVGWTDWGLDSVNGIDEGLTSGLTGLGLLLPSLVPSHVG